MDVYTATNEFVKKVNELFEQHVNKDMRHVHEKYSEVVAVAGRSYIKLEVTSGGVGRSAFGFVVINDNKMGKSGDILKAASWALPAKHSRGSVFSNENGMESIDNPFHPHIRYLK